MPALGPRLTWTDPLVFPGAPGCNRTLRFRERYFATAQDLVPTGSEDLGSAPLTYDEALEERVHGDLIDSDQDLERLDPFNR